MHEVSLVADLVDAVRVRAGGAPVRRVRVRYATTFPDGALPQAWSLLVTGDPLADAELDAAPFDIRLTCGCGFDGALAHDDVLGPTQAICPGCGSLKRTPPTPELELLEVVTAAAPAPA